MQQMQMGQAMQAAERETATRNALSGLNPNAPDYYSQGATALQGIDPIAAAGFVDKGAARQKGQLDLSAAQATAFGKQFDLLAQAAGNSRTQQDWHGHIGQMLEAGVIEQGRAEELASAQWSPDLMKQIQQGSMSAKDQLDQQFNQDKFIETKRHNLAGEETALIKANTPLVNISNIGEREEAKAFGKSLVADYGAIRETAANASNELQSLHMLRNIDVDTNSLAPMKAWVSGYAQALGVDPNTLGLDSATNSQAFIGTANSLILTKMQAQKGPQTENDAKRIAETVASLGNTPQARDFLTNAAIALREREIEQADFYDNWRIGHGKSFDGARQAWEHHKRKTPLMGKNKKSGLPVFYNEFRTLMREANPEADDAVILQHWRANYGR